MINHLFAACTTLVQYESARNSRSSQMYFRESRRSLWQVAGISTLHKEKKVWENAIISNFQFYFPSYDS